MAKLTKDEWIDAAVGLLHQYLGEHSKPYAESLYQTFVVDDDEDCTPQDAVSEDMTYWEVE